MAKNIDIILFYPSSGGSFKSSYSPPHSMLSLASELVDEYEVRIIDQRIDPEWKTKLFRYLKTNPICVAFSAMTGPQIKYALDAAKIVRDYSGNSVKLVWGGVHPSMLPDQTLENKYVDIIIRGEGEVSFKKLVSKLKQGKGLSQVKGISYKDNGKVKHNPSEALFDVNKTKPLPWFLVNVEKYIDKGGLMFEEGTGVKRMLDIGLTSRGCPHKCTFCYNLFFNKGKWRPMTSKRTYDLIKQSVDDFNLDGVWVHDDNYFVDHKRVNDVADMMIKDNLDLKWTNSGITIFTYKQMTPELKNKIVRSGCRSFRFGVETANPRIIKLIKKPNTRQDIFAINKDTKKHNIIPIYSFMIGFPSETRKEILDTCKAMVKLKKENKKSKFHCISVYTPYPGTPLFDMAVERGFKTPKSFEGWSQVYWGSKLTKISFAKVPRKYLDNVQDMSYFTSDWFNYVFPDKLNFFLKPAKMWLNFRWRHQIFNFAPELELYRKFYRMTH